MAEGNVGQFAVLAGGKALAMLLGFATTMFIGRLLGPEGLGEWTLAAAAGAMLHTTVIGWTQPAMVRFGREEWERRGTLGQTVGARTPLLALSVLVVIVLLVVQPGDWVRRFFVGEQGRVWVVAVFGGVLWLAAEAQAALQATGRIRLQGILAPLIGSTSLLALVVVWWSGRATMTMLVIAFALPAAVAWGAAWLQTLHYAHGTARTASPDEIVRHLRFGAPLVPTLLVGYLSDWGDHLLLGRYSTVEQVGLFAVAYQVMLVAMAGGGVLTTVMLPRLIAIHVRRPESLVTYVDTEVPTLYALWMLAMVWLVALVPVVIRMMSGGRFDESAVLLEILLIAVPASVVTSLYTILFNLQERMGRVLIYSTLMAATNIGLSLILIPQYAAAGAAVGTVLSYLVVQGLYIWDQHRELRVPPQRVIALWAAGLGIGVAQYAAGAEWQWRILWAVAATAGLIVVVRRGRCADAALMRRLLGAHPWLGQLAARVLAPGTAS